MSAYSDYYVSDLLDSLINGFKGYLGIPATINPTLLRFFVKESAQSSTIWDDLRNYLKKLVDADIFAPILSAVYCILNFQKAFDLIHFSDILEEVSFENYAGEKTNLKQLFIIFYHTYQESCMIKDVDYLDDTDPFTISKRENDGLSYEPQTILRVAAEVQYKELYGQTIDVGQLILSADDRTEDERQSVINKIVSSAVFRRQAKYKAILETNKAENKKRAEEDEKEKQAEAGFFCPSIRRPLSNIAKKCTDQFFPVPGTLLPLFQLAEIYGANNLALYMLQSHVLKAFRAVSWRSELNPETRLMESQFVQYAFFIRSLFSKGNYAIIRDWFDKFYCLDDFRRDILSKENPVSLFRHERTLLHHRKELCLDLEKIITDGRHLFSQAMPPDMYSFFNLFVPLSLYCTGDSARASEYLANNYYEVSEAERQRICFQVLVYRCILESNDAQTANTLLGYCAHETTRNTRDKEWMFNELWAMVDYVERVKQYLLERNEHSVCTNELWHDVVFCSKSQKFHTTIKDLIQLIKQTLESTHALSETTTHWLLDIINCLSYDPGIKLSPLGIRPRDDFYDDIIPGVLSFDLRAEGNGFVNKLEEYAIYFQSIQMKDSRQQIEDIAQNHIRQLVDKKIDETIERIEKLKTEAEQSQNADVIARIEDVVNELSVSQLAGKEGVSFIEQDILRMQAAFFQKFSLSPINLFDKVKDIHACTDIRNYLTTSEYVYRILASRSSTYGKVLDYSPALIPLTKAIERILNIYYTSLKIPNRFNEINGLTVKQEKIIGSRFYSNYYPQTDKKEITRKTSIELGPAIYSVSSRMFLSKNKLSDTANDIACDVYAKYGGKNILDISKLSVFSCETVKGLSKANSEIQLQFSNDSEYNRHVLASALHFIRENYRNKVAHKDAIKRTTFEECKELLLQSENLIWILLYILR